MLKVTMAKTTKIINRRLLLAQFLPHLDIFNCCCVNPASFPFLSFPCYSCIRFNTVAPNRGRTERSTCQKRRNPCCIVPRSVPPPPPLRGQIIFGMYDQWCTRRFLPLLPPQCAGIPPSCLSPDLLHVLFYCFMGVQRALRINRTN